MIDYTEHLEPRAFTQPVGVVARHIERYIEGVKLLGKTGKDETWLDFGCGEGYGASLLRNFATNVVGYDPHLNNQRNPRTDIHLLNHIPKALKVDVVFCIEVLEHVGRGDAETLLDEMQSVLAEGGKVVLSTPVVRHSTNEPTNRHHRFEYSLAELMELFSNVYFEVGNISIKQTILTDGERKGQGIFILE